MGVGGRGERVGVGGRGERVGGRGERVGCHNLFCTSILGITLSLLVLI